MPKVSNRAYSRYTKDALNLLAGLIRASRLEQKMSAQELAERAGISRGMLLRIEKGDPKCEIGATFEVARLVGIDLFEAESSRLAMHLQHVEEKLTLLPKRVRTSPTDIKDDF